MCWRDASPADLLRDKYVLIGATAASLGERVASPFVRYTDAHADQHGALMPGVEVLANAVNVILRSRYYTAMGDFGSFFWAAMIAALTLLLLESAQGGREFIKQILVLAGVAALIVFAGRAAFQYALVYPPMVACLVAFGAAGMLGLLRRSLVASARLDADLAQLAVSGDLLAPAGPGIPGSYHWAEGGPVTLARGWLPKGVEWKARTLSVLNARLLDRAKFVSFALRSVEDGLLIADPAGVITFANRSAGAILGSAARGLVGQDLTKRLHGAVDAATLERLASERGHVEREIALRDGARPKHYMLRMAAVSADDRGNGPVLGIVASLSDVTRQYELQQTKNDVISLVSHEMRTPLTAIQGMTELLANYDLPADRRREMNLAINDEVKRLTRMISDYLDITRLESGATAMRPAPLRADAVLERTLLLLDPVAAQRRVQLLRRFAPDLPPSWPIPTCWPEPSRTWSPTPSSTVPRARKLPSRLWPRKNTSRSRSPTRGTASRRPIWAASSKSFTGCRAWKTPARPAPGSASPSYARSPSCIRGAFPSTATWAGAQLLHFASRVRRLLSRRSLKAPSKRKTCRHNLIFSSPTMNDRFG